MPLRSPKIRQVVAGWAASLPNDEGAARTFERVRISPWSSADYVSPTSANQVAIALNTPDTGISGRAEWRSDGWEIDLVVDLPLAYPTQSTHQVGWFALEEGMFHDARPLLEPYCLEYTATVHADDPSLRARSPVRGPLERASTGILRSLGAAYR